MCAKNETTSAVAGRCVVLQVQAAGFLDPTLRSKLSAMKRQTAKDMTLRTIGWVLTVYD